MFHKVVGRKFKYSVALIIFEANYYLHIRYVNLLNQEVICIRFYIYIKKKKTKERGKKLDSII